MTAMDADVRDVLVAATERAVTADDEPWAEDRRDLAGVLYAMAEGPVAARERTDRSVGFVAEAATAAGRDVDPTRVATHDRSLVDHLADGSRVSESVERLGEAMLDAGPTVREALGPDGLGVDPAMSVDRLVASAARNVVAERRSDETDRGRLRRERARLAAGGTLYGLSVGYADGDPASRKARIAELREAVGEAIVRDDDDRLDAAVAAVERDDAPAVGTATRAALAGLVPERESGRER